MWAGDTLEAAQARVDAWKVNIETMLDRILAALREVVILLAEAPDKGG